MLTDESGGALVHVVAPVLVLAEGATVTSLVTATACLCGSSTTVPAVLRWGGGGGGGGRREGGREAEGKEGGRERGRGGGRGEGGREGGREGATKYHSRTQARVVKPLSSCSECWHPSGLPEQQ